MVAKFEDDISDGDKTKIILTLSKAMNAAEEAGVKISEIKLDMSGDSIAAANGDVWICKERGNKLICEKLKV